MNPPAIGSGRVIHFERVGVRTLCRDRKRNRDTRGVSIESGEAVGIRDASAGRVVGRIQPASCESNAKQCSGKHRKNCDHQSLEPATDENIIDPHTRMEVESSGD